MPKQGCSEVEQEDIPQKVWSMEEIPCRISIFTQARSLQSYNHSLALPATEYNFQRSDL